MTMEREEQVEHLERRDARTRLHDGGAPLYIKKYTVTLQKVGQETAQWTKDREEKSVIKAKKLQAKADAKSDLQDTATTMQADKKYLDEKLRAIQKALAQLCSADS
jgi:hypothetical protein